MEKGAAVADRRAGTAAMARRLDEISRTADVRYNNFLNQRRVALIRAVPEPSEPRSRVLYDLMLGQELLLAGRAEEAVDSLGTARRVLLGTEGLSFGPDTLTQVEEQLALAWLRLGEEDNCIAGHNTARCLLPISGAGVHAERRGSEGAMKAYLQLLERRPDDLGLVWLLNLAAMTLGGRPEAVPERFRIPREAFASEADVGRFPDVAPDLGVDVMSHAGGVVMEDFDGDGDLDLLTSGWDLDEPMHLFLSRGDGSFEDATARSGLSGLTGGLNMVQGDYDNDGDADVFVLRGAWLRSQGKHPNSLLRNEGDGTFSDVTEAAGVLSFHPTQVAAWSDYDGDGWLDLFVGNESLAEEAHPAELFHNRGDGSFEEVAAAVGVAAEAYIKGAGWGDYDDDGRPDLYVSSLNGPNLLFHNQGPRPDGGWSFREVAATAGVTEPRVSFPTWWWDFDDDGRLDLFVSGYQATIADLAAEYLGRPHHAEPCRVYRNRGDGTFEDATDRLGLGRRVIYAMGANYGDLDNDGYPDLYVGTGDTFFSTLMPNRAFRNDGGRRFQDVTTAAGLGHLQKGHGIAFGDLDRDGDQDVYAVMGGAHAGDTFTNALFENPGRGHRWLTLVLEGVEANRSAIGARIEVEVETPEGGRRSVHVLAGSGGSFGASSLQQEIGLGDAVAVRRVRVRWPGGTPQEVTGLALDAAYRLRQGDEPVRLDWKPFRLGGSEPPATRPHPRPPTG